MQKLFLVVACLLATAPAILAQTNNRSGEFFVGYSNLQAEGVPNQNDPGNTFNNDFFDRRKGLHGINASGTGFFGSALGLKGDFSFHRNDDTTDLNGGRDSIKTDVYYFMGGPVLKFRNPSRIEPFIHALAGGAHTRYDVESSRDITGGTTRTSFEASSTDFAAAIGGGLDVRLNDRFSIRAIQVDYAPVFLRDRSINVLGGAGAIQPFTLEGQRQDNIRISVGIVF